MERAGSILPLLGARFERLGPLYAWAGLFDLRFGVFDLADNRPLIKGT
jgi:hypothetical protein